MGEFIGIWGGGENCQIRWDTEATQYNGYNCSNNGQQKGVPGKTGYGYCGDQGSYNGGYNFRKTNLTSYSSSDTGDRPAKMFGNMGEENFGQGQLAGYCNGTYDGSQNNRGGRITYATDAASENNALYLPSRHGGSSSGVEFWRD